ncbi:MAG TPA: DUF6510 family protein [Pseudonocardiaceae bacterium]|jgi:hypothetical protein|nr:DUF6510 family protein [Pseudonocardiaceae bacterium]
MTDDQFVDINAVAGDLRDVFAVDITTASGKCGHCGSDGPLANGRLYGRMPALVLRCRSCDAVLLRMVTAHGRTQLDMRGLAYLQLTTA